MTIEITNASLIERQHRMQGCGVSVDMIRRAMGWDSDTLAAAISQGNTALASATAARADGIKNAIKALKIEAEIRGLSL